MKPSDVMVVEKILQVTQGGSRVLCTLARRGKAIERDEPNRAEYLLSAVRTHPFYKGGRLAFDMLEIEDLMLDETHSESLDHFEFARVLSAGAHNLIEVLLAIGARSKAGPTPPDMAPSPSYSDLARNNEPNAAPDLPRVSFGEPAPAFPDMSKDYVKRDQHEPELKASDYLYDFVVLGLLATISGLS